MYKKYLVAKRRSKWTSRVVEGCVFCRIVCGDPDVTEKTVWRNDDIMVLLNIHPYTMGHLQIVPTRHIIYFNDLLKSKLIIPVSQAIEKSMTLLSKTYSPDGFNVGLNLGRAAGNSIDHIHFHIVPRYSNREIHGFMETCAESKVVSEDIDDVLIRLKEGMNGIFE